MYSGKSFIHIHAIPNIIDFNKIQNKNIVIGSVFCKKARIDRTSNEWLILLEKIIRNNKDIKIFVQQPFYLTGSDEESFIKTIQVLNKKKLVHGILVHSFGMVKKLAVFDNLKLIMSRYSIKKRRVISSYFIDDLVDLGVVGIECFQNDSEIIKKVNEYAKIPLYIRNNEKLFNAFSKYCINDYYAKKCSASPEKCSFGESFLEHDQSNQRLLVGGHILYEENNPKQNVPELKDSVLIDNYNLLEV